MTDPEVADFTYIEPITPEIVEKIIEKELPDALWPTMGGQTALNVAVALAESGVLEKYKVELIGAQLPAIQCAEDRLLFKEAMKEIGLDLPKSEVVESLEKGCALSKDIGCPINLRPAFTLGGSCGAVASDLNDFKEKLSWALSESPDKQVLIEESLKRSKEIEL